MVRPRLIPCLLLAGRSLVKTVGFRDAKYIGDPINTVRIYNEMEVDELVFLDIEATRERRGPNFELIAEIASECFMPFAYGGGVSNIDQMQRMFALGVEKVALNTALIEQPNLITEAAARFGSQAVLASIDVRRDAAGIARAATCCGLSPLSVTAVELAKRAEELGAGEILLTSIDRDGAMNGYDIELVQAVVAAVGIPVVACGGAGVLSDFAAAVNQGRAQAAGAGSMLIYQNRNRQVLINFPSKKELRDLLATDSASRDSANPPPSHVTAVRANSAQAAATR